MTRDVGLRSTPPGSLCAALRNDLVSLIQGQLGLRPWSSRYRWWRRG